MSAAYRSHLAETANCLLRYASAMWGKAAKAKAAHDRDYFEMIGDRYFKQSCDLIDWADALAVNPDAAPSNPMASAFAQHYRPPKAVRKAA